LPTPHDSVNRRQHLQKTVYMTAYNRKTGLQNAKRASHAADGGLDRPHAPAVRYSTWFSGPALLWITWRFCVQISLRTAARGERLTSGLGGHSKGQFSRRPRRSALPLSTGEGWFFFHREPSEHELRQAHIERPFETFPPAQPDTVRR
jgi:hypothetical protein